MASSRASSQEYLDEFLDKSIQDNVKILSDVLNSLKSEKKLLEKQVSLKTKVLAILAVRIVVRYSALWKRWDGQWREC